MSTIASKVPIGWCTCLFICIALAKGLRLPMEWPAHVMFLLPLTSPTQGSWTVQIHSVALEVGCCLLFLCLWRVLGKSGGGWR